ncbi:hypothetical protein ATCC90586_011215 [Pythium insidiosum]|nr:hypothetical protein ATCC90586_011215 [Pythium insidiosum]
MTGDVGDFVEYQDLPASIWVTVANGQRLEARDSRLVSVPALTAKGSAVVQFERNHACIMVRGSIVAMIPKIGKLFVWRVKRNHDLSVSPFSHTSGSEVKTSMPFELVHSDVMGPIKPPSKGGAKYLVTFIDDFSRRVYVNVIKSKAEVFRCFKEFVAMVRTQYGLPVQRLRSDNGGEYVSKRFSQFCASQGIVHQTSAPYSPQQNGLAERMNRTIAEGVRAMLLYMNVAKECGDR